MKEKDRKMLGVIGGMGPSATQLFYQLIIEKTEAHKDQDHVNMVILNHASMPDRTTAIIKNDTNSLYEKLLEDARILESIGVDFISIPCNTSHYFIPRLQGDVGVPIIHMIKETVASIDAGVQRIGILATDGTIRTQLYQKECLEKGLIPLVPREGIQKKVMHIIYDGVKDGGALSQEDFIAIEDEMKELGCQRVILACTELSVCKERFSLGEYYLDAMTVLAQQSILKCGHKLKEEGNNI